MSVEKLIIGNPYSKRELGSIFNNSNIPLIREGISLQNNNIFLFITLDKSNKEQRHQYNDFFDLERQAFEWDSQNKQDINSYLIKELVEGKYTCLLFCRVHDKIDNTTQPFIFCGPITYRSYHLNTANPVHLVFNIIEDENPTQELQKLYTWNEKGLETSKLAFEKKPKTKPIIDNPLKNYHTKKEIDSAIEQRAMTVAQTYYKKLGYEVTDVSEIQSYHCDLSCIKEGEEKRVEVKGRRSSDGWKKVNLTYREVELALNQGQNNYHVDLFIVFGINIDRKDNKVHADNGKIAIKRKYVPRYPKLRPQNYVYRGNKDEFFFEN